MKRLIVLSLLLFAVTTNSAAARPAKCGDRILHVNSTGKCVLDLKWLVSGHKPNVFTKVKGTYKWDPKSKTKFYFGKGLSKAVIAYKYRLGWPVPQWRQAKAGREFFDLVLGRKHWPVQYVERAAKRVRASSEGRVNTAALRIKRVEESQIGVYETSWNWGPTVRQYLAAAGIYYPTFWCGAFQVWSFRRAGVSVPSLWAGVWNAAQWASQRGYLHARPKVGAVVLWVPRHMGFVSGVSSVGISTIEGNAQNGVRRRFYSWSRLPGMKFIWVPGVA